MKITVCVSFNRFEIQLPLQCIEDCSGPGSKDEIVGHWAKKLSIKIDPDLIRAEVKEYGTWNQEELQDNEQNIHRLIWIAACNAKDEIITS